MLPTLSSAGLLPPGIHTSTWDAFTTAFGQNPRRQTLLTGLRDACAVLASAGCPGIWVDGSFVTDCDTPGDYDACWDWHGVDQALLDPILLNYSPAGRAAIKAKYLGDLLISGVELASKLPFVDFFQRTRDGRQKGIVLLSPKEVP